MSPSQPLYEVLEEYEDLGFFYMSFRVHTAPTQQVGQKDLLTSEDQLITGGLLSCAALGFTSKGLNFLGHINARTPKEDIVREIREHPEYTGIPEDPEFQIYLWKGGGYPDHLAVNTIGEALEELGLLDRLAYLGTVSPLVTVGINEKGPFNDSGEKELISIVKDV